MRPGPRRSPRLACAARRLQSAYGHAPAGDLSDRLSRAASDHAEGRRPHRRDLRRPQPRRPDAEPARRRARLRAAVAARSDQRHHHRRAARRADRARRRRFDARGALDPRRLRRAGAMPSTCALPAAATCAGQHQDQLRQADGGGRPLRHVAARPRPVGRRHDLSARTGRTGISAAPRSAISPPWSTIRPTWCSRAAKRRPTPPRRSVAIDKYRKGENPSGAYAHGYDNGKISDLGK